MVTLYYGMSLRVFNSISDCSCLKSEYLTVAISTLVNAQFSQEWLSKLPIDGSDFLLLLKQFFFRLNLINFV